MTGPSPAASIREMPQFAPARPALRRAGAFFLSEGVRFEV